jgi:hypothetical protein
MSSGQISIYKGWAGRDDDFRGESFLKKRIFYKKIKNLLLVNDSTLFKNI